MARALSLQARPAQARAKNKKKPATLDRRHDKKLEDLGEEIAELSEDDDPDCDDPDDV